MLIIKRTFEPSGRLGEVTTWKERLNVKPFYKEQSLATKTAWSRKHSRLPLNRPGHNNARQKKYKKKGK
jgi:hypothetical protein